MGWGLGWGIVGRVIKVTDDKEVEGSPGQSPLEGAGWVHLGSKRNKAKEKR